MFHIYNGNSCNWTDGHYIEWIAGGQFTVKILSYQFWNSYNEAKIASWQLQLYNLSFLQKLWPHGARWWAYPGIILCIHPANDRWCYSVTSSLIGWVHTQNDICNPVISMSLSTRWCMIWWVLFFIPLHTAVINRTALSTTHKHAIKLE